MQIVINISDSLYDRLIDMNIDSDTCSFNESALVESIQNGTPLPKGHGRLGDLDALREEVSSWGMNDYEPSNFTDEIDRTDTIIEADKVKKDGDNIFEKLTAEEQDYLWMYMIFNRDKIIEKTKQWTKEAEKAGMNLTEYLESISPLNNKEKLSWLGKNCKDCGNKKCKELGKLPKGYSCALWQPESEK